MDAPLMLLPIASHSKQRAASRLQGRNWPRPGPRGDSIAFAKPPASGGFNSRAVKTCRKSSEASCSFNSLVSASSSCATNTSTFLGPMSVTNERFHADRYHLTLDEVRRGRSRAAVHWGQCRPGLWDISLRYVAVANVRYPPFATSQLLAPSRHRVAFTVVARVLVRRRQNSPVRPAQPRARARSS